MIPLIMDNSEWINWIPKEKATLVFIIKDGLILLIHKKRGLGAGKINGPGGRIEQDETPHDAAIREVQEELLVTPTSIQKCGELCFQFMDGYSIIAFVFRATDCEGEPQETSEAKPIWTPIDQIPYSKMWADDKLWIPLMLQGHSFLGRFTFDGDRMLTDSVSITDTFETNF